MPTAVETLERAQDYFRAFKIAFNSAAGLTVLDELMTFCRFRVPLITEDQPHDTTKLLIMEGRRQVFLHILQMAKFSDEQLTALFMRQIHPVAED